jgi:hypothetical protein
MRFYRRSENQASFLGSNENSVLDGLDGGGLNSDEDSGQGNTMDVATSTDSEAVFLVY